MMGSIYFYGGRVEVCYNTTYHHVCDEGWADNEATVVCRYMGYYPPYYCKLLYLLAIYDNLKNRICGYWRKCILTVG